MNNAFKRHMLLPTTPQEVVPPKSKHFELLPMKQLPSQEQIQIVKSPQPISDVIISTSYNETSRNQEGLTTGCQKSHTNTQTLSHSRLSLKDVKPPQIFRPSLVLDSQGEKQPLIKKNSKNKPNSIQKLRNIMIQ